MTHQEYVGEINGYLVSLWGSHVLGRPLGSPRFAADFRIGKLLWTNP